jgi:divalent metal cation (Fe/Co/Zn/Cd) transporter
MHVTMDGACTLNEAHTATEKVEAAIQAFVAMADVTVHVEPAEVARENPRPPQNGGRRTRRGTKEK